MTPGGPGAGRAACSSARSRAAATWPSCTPRIATGFALSLDDGRVEAPQRGREAARALRVVQGDSTYYGYVDGLAEPDLMRVADSVAQAVRGAGAAARRARGGRAAPTATRWPSPPTRAGRAQGRPPARVRRARTLRGRRGRPGAGGLRRVAPARGGLQLGRRAPRPTTARACGSASRWWPGAATAWRPAATRAAGTPASSCSRTSPRRWPTGPPARALTLLDAVDAPTGRLPVVVGNGFGGVLLHEAVGHGLEADAIQKGASVYAGRLGDQLAEPFVTAYDDGARRNEWGSDGIDDEGTPTRRTTVIEDGRLTSYLYDLLRARTRRRGVHRQRAPRVLPPPADPADDEHLLRPGRRDGRGADRGRATGLYAVSFGGGQVEPATGDFVFGVSEGYLIEDGRVTAPVRGATLIGNGLQALARDRRDRGRPRHRHRLLRQGGPVGARGRGPAARADPRAHRGRHGVSVDLEARAGRAVEAAAGAGATDAEALAEEDQSRRVRVYQGEVESLSDAGGRGVGVRAFVGGRSGYAYATDLSDAGLARGGHAPRARRRRWPTRTSAPGCRRVRRDAGRRPRLARAGRWTTERKVELALAAERAARARDGVTQVEATVYSDAEASVALANSRGFAAAYRATQAWAYASAFAGEGADLMTGLGVGMGRDPGALDPEAIGGEAAERALALVGARQPESRRCPVVLDAFVAASFVGVHRRRCCPPTPSSAAARCSPAARARRWPTRRSSSWTTPPIPTGPPARPSTARARATRRTPLIEDGRLLTFLFDVRTARRAGRETTASASRGSYRSPPSVGHLEPDRRAGRRRPRRALARRGRRPLRDRRGRASTRASIRCPEPSPWGPPAGSSRAASWARRCAS